MFVHLPPRPILSAALYRDPFPFSFCSFLVPPPLQFPFKERKEKTENKKGPHGSKQQRGCVCLQPRCRLHGMVSYRLRRSQKGWGIYFEQRANFFSFKQFLGERSGGERNSLPPAPIIDKRFSPSSEARGRRRRRRRGTSPKFQSSRFPERQILNTKKNKSFSRN